MRSKVRGLWPAVFFTAVMLFLAGLGVAEVAAGRHMEGIGTITLGAWTWLAWAAGYGMHAWKRHAEVIGEIRATMARMENMLGQEPARTAGPKLSVVPPPR